MQKFLSIVQMVSANLILTIFLCYLSADSIMKFSLTRKVDFVLQKIYNPTKASFPKGMSSTKNVLCLKKIIEVGSGYLKPVRPVVSSCICRQTGLLCYQYRITIAFRCLLYRNHMHAPSNFRSRSGSGSECQRD